MMIGHGVAHFDGAVAIGARRQVERVTGIEHAATVELPDAPASSVLWTVTSELFMASIHTPIGDSCYVVGVGAPLLRKELGGAGLTRLVVAQVADEVGVLA